MRPRSIFARSFSSSVAEPQPFGGVSHDHAFLVGRNHPGGYARGISADTPFALRIARFVQYESQPAATFGHGRACRSIVLANATREDDTIHAAERGGERSDLTDDAIDKQRNGLSPTGYISRLRM